MIPTDIEIDPALRLEAESLLDKTRDDIRAMDIDEVLKAMHTFQLRLIELTVQNEALRLAQSNAEISSQQYCKLFDFAPVGYLLLDKDGMIMKANLMVATFLGCEQSDLKGQKFSKFIKPEFQDVYHVHYRHAYKSGDSQTCELQLENEDSTPVTICSQTIDAPDKMCLTTLS